MGKALVKYPVRVRTKQVKIVDEHNEKKRSRKVRLMETRYWSDLYMRNDDILIAYELALGARFYISHLNYFSRPRRS